jgi:polyisoprenoid-binding protein YceI
MKPWIRWVVAGIVAVLLIVVVAPFVYINFIKDDAPERLTVDSVTTTTGSGTTGDDDPSTTTAAGGEFALDGEWTIAPGSVAGYRATEVLFGQDTEAVGRTEDVTGTVTFDGATVSAAEFTVDLTTVESDESRRDNQFQGRIMDTANFPTATFELTSPITLDSIPAAGEEVTVQATGDLMLRGTTKSVTVDLQTKHDGSTITLAGSIPIVWDEWGIPEPSFGPASVADDGEIEFALLLTPAT